MDNRAISDRILLEDVPSGRYYLEIITTAMRENRQIVIDYEDFFGNTKGLSLFHQAVQTSLVCDGACAARKRDSPLWT